MNTNPAMTITSPAFQEGDFIPAKYTGDGQDVNPPLRIEGVPRQAQSLVLIVDDPDAPMGTWNHWLLWNLDPSMQVIAERSVPVGAEAGTNDFRKREYGGPMPPSGVHRYFFKVFALDTVLKLSVGSNRAALDRALEGHVIAQGQLMGRYARKR